MPCMAPPPKFAIPPWPDAQPDGTTILAAADVAQVLLLLTMLIDYIEEQHARCATPSSSLAPAPDAAVPLRGRPGAVP